VESGEWGLDRARASLRVRQASRPINRVHPRILIIDKRFNPRQELANPTKLTNIGTLCMPNVKGHAKLAQ
jgi:hypothetical protein